MQSSVSELIEAWQLAIQREKQSRDSYTRMAHASADASVKALFESLSGEEARHLERLQEEYRRLFEADMESKTFEEKAAGRGSGRKLPPSVAWLEWGQDAFRQARDRDVPILLSIGAVWCHWCHVMDEGTFSNPEVAAVIAARFVPVRVDNDMRPDINSRYNMGGWPTVAFLTPDGDVITGGTYSTPAAFVETLRWVSDYYRGNKAAVERRVGELGAQHQTKGLDKEPGELTSSIIESVYLSAASTYDAEYGGFGTAPKFPQEDAIELFLAHYRRTGEQRALEMATSTLTAMSKGGLYDHEVGGFFRYSTTRDWSIPHFEKMAEDNARLLLNYLHAYQLTGDASLRATAEGIVVYVDSALRDHELGVFYGSQDADEQYYALPKAERTKRPAPYVDTVVYTSWNALMSIAYLEAAAVLERPELATDALATLRFLWGRCWTPDRGMCHFWDGQARLPGLLADQAWMGHALLHGYEFTAGREHLQRAQSVAQWVASNLTAGSGAFLDRPREASSLGRLGQLEAPLAENAVMAAMLTRLSRCGGDDAFARWASTALGSFAVEYVQYKQLAAGYALAVDNLINEPLREVVVGQTEDELTLSLLRAAWRPYAPNRALIAVDPVWETGQLKALGYPPEPAPRAYICLARTCADPVATPSAVIEAIDHLHQTGRPK